jgi:hypothetical protein
MGFDNLIKGVLTIALSITTFLLLLFHLELVFIQLTTTKLWMQLLRLRFTRHDIDDDDAG